MYKCAECGRSSYNPLCTSCEKDEIEKCPEQYEDEWREEN